VNVTTQALVRSLIITAATERDLWWNGG